MSTETSYRDKWSSPSLLRLVNAEVLGCGDSRTPGNLSIVVCLYFLNSFSSPVEGSRTQAQVMIFTSAYNSLLTPIHL